jgi:hypothetical protein
MGGQETLEEAEIIGGPDPMPSVYSPETIRRLKELGAIDLGLSFIPLWSGAKTRARSAWTTDEDTDYDPDRPE